jgi:hypothetical protein
VSPVKYEMGFYISEDGVPRNHRCENRKPYMDIVFQYYVVLPLVKIRHLSLESIPFRSPPSLQPDRGVFE